MNWLLPSLLAPIFWAASNHIDKFLLSKHFKDIGKEALMMYSTLFGIVVLPLAYFFDSSIFSVGLVNIIILVSAGCLSAIAIYFYLFALEEEETSIVAPFMQLIPVFGFMLGFLILKETLSINQITGALVIIVGAAILSIEIDELRNARFKKRVFILMSLCSASFALYEILFKLVAIENGFWLAVFWEYVGLVIFGIILFLASKKHRDDFLVLIKRHNWSLVSINITNEALTILGNMFRNFATLLAPVALVMSISGYQPIFVLAGSVFLTLFFPKVSKENITVKHLAHKVLAILIVIAGTFLIYSYD